MNTSNRHFGAFTLTALLLSLFINSSAMCEGFGIKAGLSSSRQSYEYDIAGFEVERLSQYGISAGIFLSYKVSNLPELRFEVDYVQKGSSIDLLVTTEQYPDGFERIMIQDRIHYISINVLALPVLQKGWTIAPYLIIGPRIDILAGSTSDFPSLVLDDLKSTVFGATIGAGIILNSNSAASLLVEIIYNPDFSYAYEKGVLTVKNNTIQLMTGISF